MNILNLIQQT